MRSPVNDDMIFEWYGVSVKMKINEFRNYFFDGVFKISLLTENWLSIMQPFTGIETKKCSKNKISF